MNVKIIFISQSWILQLPLLNCNVSNLDIRKLAKRWVLFFFFFNI